jgi:hypothetical protein
MNILVGAPQNGRRVELPSNEKLAAPKTLADLMGRGPERSRGDLVDLVLKRETQTPSGIGPGGACPQVRVSGNGELLPSVGWSLAGIEYGSIVWDPVLCGGRRSSTTQHGRERSTSRQCSAEGAPGVLRT